MKLPIIIVELSPGDVSFYDSVESMFGPIEPVDVFNGEYRGFDSEGRLLSLVAEGKRPLSPVLVELAEETPTHIEELRDHLIRDLSHSDLFDDLELAEASIAELIEKHRLWTEISRQRRPGCWPKFLRRQSD